MSLGLSGEDGLCGVDVHVEVVGSEMSRPSANPFLHMHWSQ